MSVLDNVFKRSIWILLTVFFFIWLLVFVIGGQLAMKNSGWINSYLDINPYVMVIDESDDPTEARYYLSDYETMDSEGNVTYNHNAMRANSMDKATKAATEGSVLLWNNDVGGKPALPLDSGSKISLFGVSCLETNYITSGGGSGHVTITTVDNLKTSCEEQGLTVNNQLWSAYKLVKTKGFGRAEGKFSPDAPKDDDNYVDFKVGEASWEALHSTTFGDMATSTVKQYGDAAVMIISRYGSENGDTDFTCTECLDNNYMDLAINEDEILTKLDELKEAGTIKRIVLAINTAAPMSMKNILKHDIDACLWVGYGGNASYDQVAQLLAGTAYPYGRANDAWAMDTDSAPATVNFGDFTFTSHNGVPATTTYTHNTKYVVYAEGIYVGYRYYETRYEDSVLGGRNATGAAGVTAGDTSDGWSYTDEVAFPFGHGESYTTFAYSDYSVTRNASGDYEVTMTITNTGEYKGKDVMQVYIQKPYTTYDEENHIEKASVELVGYAKTRELEPNGDSQTLTVTVPAYEFKSYDAYGEKTYIVESGEYYLASGRDSHDALNNILAAKGKTTADGMDYNGNSALACKITSSEKGLPAYDEFSVSPFTENEVTNRFDDADINIYEGTKGQEITYLSRSDWNGTYPTPVSLACTSERMVRDMQYGPAPATKGEGEKPIYGTVTSSLGKLKLAMLMDLEYDDPMWDDLLNQLTYDESVTLVTAGSASFAGATSVAAPGGKSQDGPCGIRDGDILDSWMAFPCNGLLAATWNDALVEELGNAFGMEILHAGWTGIYGTGANTHRCAYSGRAWEYYSEDGFLSGKIFAAEVRGLQNRGVITYNKHFVLNDQERNRYGGTVWANEQSIREIYLKAFEAGVTEGHANGMMSSFNRIGCTWAGSHKGLLTGVLRDEWNFIGMVETDAGVGTHMLTAEAYAAGVVAGQDIWMGGANVHAFDNYKENPEVLWAIREAAHRNLYTQLHSNAMNGMTKGSDVIYITPWWQKAITAGQIVSGVLTGLCLLMAVASFLLPIFIKKNKDSSI